LFLLLLPLALQTVVGFGLSNNVPQFCPICNHLSPSSHSQHLEICLYFFSPSLPGPSPSFRPFQFLSEDLFGHPVLLHSLQVTQPTYSLPLYQFYYIFSFTHLFYFSIRPTFPFPIFIFRPYILLNIFLSKINKACSSFFVIESLLLTLNYYFK